MRFREYNKINIIKTVEVEIKMEYALTESRES